MSDNMGTVEVDMTPFNRFSITETEGDYSVTWSAPTMAELWQLKDEWHQRESEKRHVYGHAGTSGCSTPSGPTGPSGHCVEEERIRWNGWVDQQAVGAWKEMLVAGQDMLKGSMIVVRDGKVWLFVAAMGDVPEAVLDRDVKEGDVVEREWLLTKAEECCDDKG